MHLYFNHTQAPREIKVGLAMKRVIGLIGWLKLFVSILKNRGKTTYGKETIAYLVEKYTLEFSMPLIQYQAAEKFVQEIALWCLPQRSWSLERIGGDRDGGYWIPRGLNFDLLISGGIGKNNNFEFHFAEKGCKVLAFDPTVKTVPRLHPGIDHRRVWLKANTGNRKDRESLKRCIKENSQFKRTLVKLDIEGDEYEVLMDSLEILPAVDLFVVEFHDLYRLANPDFLADLRKILQRMGMLFTPVSFTSNNWKNHIQFGSSFIPEVFEVTFLANKLMAHLEIEPVTSPQIQYLNNPDRLAIPHLPFRIDSKIKDDKTT